MPKTAERPNVRKIIAEAVTDGLSPEVAAEMLLEPSRWEKMLFGPTKDLQTLYKQYLQGKLGIGELANAVGSVAVSSGDMMDLSDRVVQEYGTDVTPGDIPSSTDVVDRVNPEDEQIEVLQYDDGDVVKRILDSIQRKWDHDLLYRLYSEAEELDEANLFQGGISAEDLQQFEKGRFFNNAVESARELYELMRSVGNLYDRKQWAELAQLYTRGGPIDMATAGLAGDVMVLRDVAQAAARAGYGDVPVGGISSFEPQLRARAVGEAWKPALIDPAYTSAVSQLFDTMSAAIQGDLTYDGLLQGVAPYAKTGGPIFNMARRQARGGEFRTPFTWDQANADKLAQSAQPGIPYEPTPGTDVDLPSPDEPLPEPPGPRAGQFQDVSSAAAQARQELGIDGEPAPPEQPSPSEPEPPQTPTPAPAQPRSVQKAVTQAITGEPKLSDIFAQEKEPVADVSGTYSLLLGVTPERAQQLQAYLQNKGKDPQKFAGMLKDAFAVIQQLGLTPSGWRSFARANPELAKKAQRVMQQHIEKKLNAGEEVMSHDLARIGVRALSSI